MMMGSSLYGSGDQSIVNKKMILVKSKHRNLGTVSVEYSLVMAITLTIVIAAAQAMNPNMESFFEAAATKIENFLGGGSSNVNSTPDLDTETYDYEVKAADARALEQQRLEAAQGGQDTGGGGGFWSKAWGATKQVGGFFKGVGEQGWDTVVGLGTLAYDVQRLTGPTALIYEVFDPEGQAALRNKYAQVGQAIWNNPGDVAYAIVEPIVTDWKNGNYGEAIGRGTFEVATAIFTPTKLGKAGKIGDAVEDIAGAANAVDNVVTKADDISDAGQVAGKVDDVGRLNVDDLLGNPDDIVVLGRQPDTAVAKDWPGHVILDVPADQWSIALNDAFIEAAIKQRRRIYIGSPTTRPNLYDDVAERPTVFGREMEQLRNAGYRQVGDYMEPPDTGGVASRIDNSLTDEALPTDPPYNPRETRDALEERYGAENVESTTVPNANAKNVELAGQRHPETGIVFDQRGFPIFDDVAKYDTRLSADEFSSASYRGQMRMATRELRDAIDNGQIPASQFTNVQLRAIRAGKDKIPGYTWHHHQDIGRMQLVPEDIHRRTGHIGGERMAQGN